jgi:aminopeptidase N
MDSPRSLTRREAERRAALLAVDRYDIAIDLTGMIGDGDFRAVSTIAFRCLEPGESSFLDAALDVVSATLNGDRIDPEHIGDSRIELADLRADNVLVVETIQRDTAHGEWVHRAVDPSDKEVYVWTSFEPDDARRAWACFDQPDLKAPHHFTVTAPARWRVVSNSGDPSVEEAGDAKTWDFPDTPPLSTYVPVVNAGPFYELRSERGGYDLGVLTRQSLSPFLDRDADELFEVTAQGLAFYGERFGLPFPQHTYDQVFLPDMGGAMENYGCVSWTDSMIYRSEPTHSEREIRALILLHEMAHMWFGDIVTMRWWEDLWLNEAFAEWACHWAAEAATRFTDAWAGFLADDKLSGYAADMAPTTHPIRQPVNDVAEAAASFDNITYPKGASVLKQLHAYLGEEIFIAGLRSYFNLHAWSNTRLDDLMSAFGTASGRDLSEWTRAWLDTAGTDRLVLEVGQSGGHVLRATGPNGGEPRPHRLDIGAYQREGEGLVRRRLVSLETSGATTEVPDLGDADFLLVNDDDLTFASVRPDRASMGVILNEAAALPTAVARGIAVTTAWDMLVNNELPTSEFVACIRRVLPRETADSTVEPYLWLAVEAADEWSPADQRDVLMSLVADMCVDLAQNDARRTVAVRALAQTAVTDDQLAELRDLAGDDVDLGWRMLIRLAELGRIDRDEVDGLQRRDPDPDSWLRALAVDSAAPDAGLKDVTWKAILEDHRVPVGSLGEVRQAFWTRSQDDLLAPYADRYLAALPTLHSLGMIPALSITNALFPRAGVGMAFAERAEELARAGQVLPVVRRSVIERVDRLRRMERARNS